MEAPTIKDILYHQVSKITESKILRDIASGRRKEIVTEILHGCIADVSRIDGDEYENFGIFAEGLSHYLLTNALIPSQRKITVKGTEVDIIIPDSRTLDVSPKDALVLCFIKTGDEESILKRLATIHDVQPHRENVWLVSKSKLPVPHKSFCIDDLSFASLLDDIDGFLSSKPQSKLRIFRT